MRLKLLLLSLLCCSQSLGQITFQHDNSSAAITARTEAAIYLGTFKLTPNDENLGRFPAFANFFDMDGVGFVSKTVTEYSYLNNQPKWRSEGRARQTLYWSPTRQAGGNKIDLTTYSTTAYDNRDGNVMVSVTSYTAENENSTGMYFEKEFLINDPSASTIQQVEVEFTLGLTSTNTEGPAPDEFNDLRWVSISSEGEDQYLAAYYNVDKKWYVTRKRRLANNYWENPSGDHKILTTPFLGPALPDTTYKAYITVGNSKKFKIKGYVSGDDNPIQQGGWIQQQMNITSETCAYNLEFKADEKLSGKLHNTVRNVKNWD